MNDKVMETIKRISGLPDKSENRIVCCVAYDQVVRFQFRMLSRELV